MADQIEKAKEYMSTDFAGKPYACGELEAKLARLEATVLSIADANGRYADENKALKAEKVATAEIDGLVIRQADTIARLLDVLKAIRDHRTNEVAKDEFAYDRMVENYRSAARQAITLAKDAGQAPQGR